MNLVRFGFRFVIFVLFFTSQVVRIYAQHIPIHIDLSKKNQGPIISPLLFGHNLEVTRRGFWSGLSAQMVANRKFAAASHSLPSQWKVVGSEGSVRIDTTVAYAGKQSVAIAIPNRHVLGGIMQKQEMIAVKQGDSYVFRIWVKTAEQRGIWINFYDAEGQHLFKKKFMVPVGDWELLTCEFKATSTNINCALSITSKGQGQYWIGAVSLLPLRNFYGMRPDVVELLKRLHPGSLRFPGGCYAEFYSWKEGLLPVDRRAPIYKTGLDFLLRDTDDTDNNEMGTDEFIALCKAVGAEPVITARVSENSPQDAADWVSYCNAGLSSNWGMARIERGFQEPFNVRWWFVGNELYSFGRGLANGIVGVSEQTNIFSHAMKAVDSTIHLVPCTKFGGADLSDEWNKPLLGAVGQYAGAVTAHQYILDTYPLRTPEDYAFMLNAPEVITYPMLGSVRKYLDTAQSTKGRKIGIAFDEWNTRWGLKGNVTMGLYVARMLNMLCREGDKLGLSMACYFMPVNEGAITVNPLNAELDAAGHVFEMFSVHQGNRLLEIAQRDEVDVSASLSSDGQHVYATVVDGLESEQTIDFSFLQNEHTESVVLVKRMIPASLGINETRFSILEEKHLAKAGKFSLVIHPGEILQVSIDLWD
jgi:alpha-N-arabinofuranosidase